MKKFVFLGVFMLAMLMIVPVASANRDNVGCGLGTMVFAGNMDSTLMQILAVTTNGTSGNQTFGITSGTSECSQPASFVKNERLNEFVAANMDSLVIDVATGSGESLDTLAELMGVEKAQRAEFFATLKANFSSIFTSGDVQSAEVIDNITKVTS